MREGSVNSTQIAFSSVVVAVDAPQEAEKQLLRRQCGAEEDQIWAQFCVREAWEAPELAWSASDSATMCTWSLSVPMTSTYRVQNCLTSMSSSTVPFRTQSPDCSEKLGLLIVPSCLDGLQHKAAGAE